ncbi:hypothetical protein EYF80_038506 [Liparis tanakae]|uniref:Uncharacterized protein n=1 Tax=Liparis tanakae TaxID=230148 RepID=A0A4Z2GCL1_9TELE|nr:hypothetical protein EYF80_038506 [Liparis tanakae]
MIIARNEKGRRVVKSGSEGWEWRLPASWWLEGTAGVETGGKWEDKKGGGREGCRSEEGANRFDVLKYRGLSKGAWPSFPNYVHKTSICRNRVGSDEQQRESLK